MTTFDSQLAASPGALERNLNALAARSPNLGQAIANGAEPDGLEFFETDERGAVSGSLAGRALASHRRPLTEASRLAETIDPKNAGAVVILGFGLGHHVKAIAERCRSECVLIVHEPDVALLRAVLSRIDHSDWLRRSNIILATDPDDGAALTSALRDQQGLLAMGVRIVEHPPSRQRLGDSAARFCETFSRVLAAVRTTVVTTLVQSEATVRNFLGNARAYVENPGIVDLAKRCVGFPAITVAAGPSLARNVELLKTPGLRDRCVIIAAQTVLKPLLAMGVKPHFVTSLDFHEISARFYEGLRPEDVAETTLIVEPKANPAIVRAYPGPKRLPAERTLDVLLGDEFARDHGAIRAGSTVAHLSYFVARLLGCDPVIMIGQDLGFTDGLYYANGAAIHNVWSGELNEFRTLEMLEWERIARHRRQLRKVKANGGAEIYTDEQMATYLAEFERLLLEDARAGRTTIDATEGGAAKANAQTMSLADALAAHLPPEDTPLPDLSAPAPHDEDTNKQWRAASERIASVRRDVVRLAKISRDTDQLLERMLDHLGDAPTLNRLIRKSHKLRDEAQSMTTAFALVQRLNQMGAFKRVRADREITLTDDLSPEETQRRRIERDRVNVQWIADAAEALLRMLDDAIAEHAAAPSAPGVTRRPNAGRAAPSREAVKLLGAVVVFDPERTALGVARDGLRPIAGRPALAWTLARLARSERLRRAIILTTDESAARAVIDAHPVDLDVDVVSIDTSEMRRPATAASRLWSRTSWRGGVANASCHDEHFLPGAMHRALTTHNLRAGLLIGADWSFVDPALCDDVIDRWVESPDGNLLTFSQAPPGLCGCVIDRALLDQALANRNLGVLGTIGGMLGYHPRRPTADPIAQRACAAIDPAIRDAHARFVVDDPRAQALLESLGETSLSMNARNVIAHAERMAAPAPEHVIIELCAGRPAHGAAPSWATDRKTPWRAVPRERTEELLRAVGASRDDAVVTFTGTGDPLTHPDLIHLLHVARECGVAGAHVRTPLLAPRAAMDDLLTAPLDVLSVDLYANTAVKYEQLTGADGFRTALENIDHLIQSRPDTAPNAIPWITPRITRCEATLDEIEAFYDKWLIVLGAAVIDPLPQGVTTGRIAALDLPPGAALRRRASTAHVAVDADASDFLIGARQA